MNLNFEISKLLFAAQHTDHGGRVWHRAHGRGGWYSLCEHAQGTAGRDREGEPAIERASPGRPPNLPPFLQHVEVSSRNLAMEDHARQLSVVARRDLS